MCPIPRASALPTARPISGIPPSKITKTSEMRSRCQAVVIWLAPSEAATAKESRPRGRTNASSFSMALRCPTEIRIVCRAWPGYPSLSSVPLAICGVMSAFRPHRAGMGLRSPSRYSVCAEVDGMLTWSGSTSGNTRRRRLRRRTWPVSRRGPRSRTQLIMLLAVPMAIGLALGVVAAVSGGPARITASPAGAQAAPITQVANYDAHTNMDCELIVPPNPLTATGLATPYQLTGPGGQDPGASGCTQANPNLQAFVQATILNPASGRLWVYEPLVITAGVTPAVAPVQPRLPRNAVVNLMVGFNGNNLQLAGARPDTLARA